MQHEESCSDLGHLREIAETRLGYEQDLNLLRMDNLDGLERMSSLRLAELEESLELREEIDRLERELHRVQQAEAAIAHQQSYATNNSSSVNQRQDRGNANERTPVIFDNELRRLLTSGDLLVQSSLTNLVNQRTSEQIADELKTLREKVKTLENSLASKSQKDEHNENGSHVSQNIQFSTLLEKTIGDVTHKMRLEEKLGKIDKATTLREGELQLLRSRMEAEKEEREVAREQVDRLTRCVSSKMESDKLKQQSQEFRWRESEMRSEISSLKEELRRKEGDLDNAVTTLRRERASGEEKVQLAERGRLEAEQRALKEELDRRKLEKLEKDVRNRETELDDLHSRLKETEDKKEQLKRDEEKVYIENEQLRCQLTEATLQLSQTRNYGGGGSNGTRGGAVDGYKSKVVFRDLTKLTKDDLQQKLLTSEERIAKLQDSLRKAAEIHKQKKDKFKDEIDDLKYRQQLRRSLGINAPASTWGKHSNQSEFKKTSNQSASKRYSDQSAWKKYSNQSKAPNIAGSIGSISSKTDYPIFKLRNNYSGDAAFYKDGHEFRNGDSKKALKDGDFDLDEIFSAAEQRTRRSNAHHILTSESSHQYASKPTRANLLQTFPFVTDAHQITDPYLYPCEIVHAKTRTKANAILEKIANYQQNSHS